MVDFCTIIDRNIHNSCYLFFMVTKEIQICLNLNGAHLKKQNNRQVFSEDHYHSQSWNGKRWMFITCPCPVIYKIGRKYVSYHLIYEHHQDLISNVYSHDSVFLIVLLREPTYSNHGATTSMPRQSNDRAIIQKGVTKSIDK